MLNPFPSLLTYAVLGPVILRAIVGLIFFDLGRFKFKGERERWIASFEALHLKPANVWVNVTAGVEIVGGLLLILGLYTQVAALVLTIFTAAEVYIEWKDSTLLKRSFSFYILILAVLLSLLVTGAGLPAFDIPL